MITKTIEDIDAGLIWGLQRTGRLRQSPSVSSTSGPEAPAPLALLRLCVDKYVMTRGRVACTVVAATVFCPITQLRAEDKEPFAVIELGAATERSIQESVYSAGPSAAVEFPIIKDWLEIETGISPLFRQGQTEWQVDLLFKKPFTLDKHVEFMIGAGPQWSYATAGGGTKVAAELALEWMIWPTGDRKYGWFVEPTYSYSFSRGHEQAVGVTTGLLIAIP
jgi:hypothetical protein